MFASATVELLGSALLLGLVSSPHCVVMCGPACAALGGACAPEGAAGRSLVAWQFGRAVGYAAAGAIVASAGASMLWASARMPAVKSLWVLSHALAFAWGLILLARARPPAIGSRISRKLGEFVQRTRRPLLLPLLIGMSWAVLPCGLLYSGLMLAVLSGTPVAGAEVMLAFAAGSGVALGLMPVVLRRVAPQPVAGEQVIVFDRVGTIRPAQRFEAISNRLAGAVLAGIGAWALYSDVFGRGGPWCA